MKTIKKLFFCILLIASLFTTNASYIFDSKAKETSTNSDSKISKVVYLTLDDGPSDSTDKILTILNKYKISATFFVVGPKYHKKDELIKKLIQNNHSIAIHSYTHEFSKIYKNKESFLNDFYSSVNWLESTFKIHPKLYRFPGGSSNSIATKQLIKEIIKELYDNGYKHVDWNVDSYDSKYSLDSTKIFQQTINNIKKNEKNNIYTQTILMHDSTKKEATLDALPKIIEYCLNNNYSFKVLNEKSSLVQHIKSPK